ncbi:MAG: hypothetical protein H0W12_08505 [Chitinophagaceae bacterium]|nr:hypothetical protein [Chitinophagaceae bacterium]
MKFFTKGFVLFALLMSFLNSKAQNQTPKPHLFDAFAPTISCVQTELDKIFTTAAGNPIQVAFTGNLSFTGTVLSSLQRYSNLQNVVIKSSLFDGAIFGISKRINDDNSITYVGRIINEKYADGYELKIDGNGKYYLNKINMDDLLQDHELF